MVSTFFFTMRSVNRMYLLKGSRQLGVVTDGLFGKQEDSNTSKNNNDTTYLVEDENTINNDNNDNNSNANNAEE